MVELEQYVLEQIRSLVPDFEKLDLSAKVNSFSYSIEFFVTVNKKRLQCFEMIDNGLLSEDSFNIASKNIANYIRHLPNYDDNGINEYSISLVNG